MKRVLIFFISMLCIGSLVSCNRSNLGEGTIPATTVPTLSESPETYQGKILIAYFSLTEVVEEGADAVSSATPYIGNTESVAREIQSQIGGDIFKIQTERVYPSSHSACSDIARQELSDDAHPTLTSHVEHMSDYEVIFIGYPIWWYTAPMAIRSFLEEYDFSGKVIVPFCTTLGAGISQSIGDINRLCPDATILTGLTLSTGRADNRPIIANWLDEIGMKE
ncbi:MAG: flavodoxin [Ruminococcus flavefaciens]|nr:flavodoxin [Ruminococcus flavefaciens]